MKFQPVHPFNYSRLYGDEKYSLQNMLLNEVSMPTDIKPGDEVFEVYCDRAPMSFWGPLKKYQSRESGDAKLAGLSQPDLLAWASDVFTAIEKRSIKLTGAVAVRFTNVASGYPSVRLTGVIAKDTPERQYGVPRITTHYDSYYMRDGRLWEEL